jgi:hypothetical protein
MKTFELYLDNHPNNLLLNQSCIWVCKYAWKFSPQLGVYTVIQGKKVTLLSMLTNSKEGHFLSNGIPTDYRMENISKLEVNRAQYQKLTHGYTSKYKGVSYFPQRKSKPWLAQKSCGGQRVLQKYFRTELEAAFAYNQATIECIGHEEAFFGKHLNEFLH